MIIRRLAAWLSICCLLSVTAPLVAADDDETRKAILAALDKKISLDTSGKSLAQAASAISDAVSVSVILDEKAIRDIGLSPDTPLTARRLKMSARHALTHLLWTVELTWMIRDEAVVITTPEVAWEGLRTRVYAVGDLVKPADDKWNFLKDQEALLDYDFLINLIGAVTPPGAWPDGTGPLQGMAPFRQCVVIHQSEDVHDLIAGLLDALRKARAWHEDHPHAAPDPPWLLTSQGGKSAVLDALQRTADVELKESTLAEVAHKLSDLYDIPVFLDEADLEYASHSPSKQGAKSPKVSFAAKSISLRSALVNVLEPLDFTYYIMAGAVMIGTEDAAEQQTDTRVYPVADLAVHSQVDSDDIFDGDSLKDLIRAIVRPQSWDGVGGPGVIEPFERCHCLVIAHTPAIHDEIASLLAALREKVTMEKREEQASAVKDDEVRRIVYHLRQFDSIGDSWTGFVQRPLQQLSEQEIVDTLKELISPDTWNDKRFYLKAVGNHLVVRHTVATHREILKLSAQLRVELAPVDEVKWRVVIPVVGQDKSADVK